MHRHRKTGRGPACCAGPSCLIKYQPACKPGSVGPAWFARRYVTAIPLGQRLPGCLKQPTRTASLTSPCGVIAIERTVRYAVPIRFCSRCGLPCRLRCRKRGALLPHLFTLTSPIPKGMAGGSFSVALSLGVPLARNPAGRYPAPYVDGARTFLPRDLSILAGAAVQPTDAAVMGARAREVKR